MRKVYLSLVMLMLWVCLPGQARQLAKFSPIIDPGPSLQPIEQQVNGEALPANAKVINNAKEELRLQPKAKAERGNVAQSSARKAGAKRVAKPLSEVLGTYMSVDYSYYTKSYDHHVVKILQRNDSLLVNNMFGAQTDLVASYDATAGVLTIKPQFIYDSESYGKSWICSWDGVKPLVYDTETPITATVQADGSLKLSCWGVYVMEGSQKGGVFNAYTESSLKKPNATMHTVEYSTNTEKDYPLLVEQTADNQLSLANFIDNGKAVNMTLRPDSTSYISAQQVATLAVFGDFTLNAANAKGKIDKYGYISGTKTAGGISLSPWGVFCVKSTSIVMANIASSEIKFNGFEPKYPTKVAVNFDGDGSEASPYKIKTLADLKALAQSVTDGESYKGKYLALAGDIDASVESATTYQQIGFDDKNYFDGTFDGANHTISGLKANFNGDNYGGLFGIIGANATIKNLSIKDADVAGSGRYLGIVVGYNKGGNVENCHVTGAVDGNVMSVGGVVGYSEGPVSKCDFDGTIIGGAEVGGVIGAIKNNNVSDCHSSAIITVEHYYPNSSHGAGGVIGDAIGKSKKWVNVQRCYFTGSVYDKQKAAYVGGVIGGLYAGSVRESFNTGSLTCASGQVSGGTAQGAGGVTGYLSNGEVVNCYNAGAVNAPYNNESSGIVGYAGGFTNSASRIHSSYSSGMVENNTTFEYKGVMGSYFNKSVLDIKDAYYDYQSSGMDTVSVGYKSTAELTSGEPLPGFSTDVWYFEKGFYPRLKTLKDNDVADLSAAAIFLTKNENAHKVKNAFTVSGANNIVWGVLSNGQAVAKGDGIVVNGTNVTLTGNYGRDHLLAINKNGDYKYFDIYAVAADYTGEGTKVNPYQIKNKADLQKLADAVSVYHQTHRGDYFVVTNDIDLQKDANFKGIATQTGQVFFEGQFDGANHTVHNFVLDGATDKVDYLGLFGICGPKSVIKNVRIAKDCKFDLYRYSAPVVGYTEGKVINCRNYADVNAYGVYTAGVVGAAAVDTALIESCYNAGTINTGSGSAGGVTGYNAGTLIGSRNDGAVNCSLKGTSSNSIVGGLAGYNFGLVKNSQNTAPVDGQKQVGGIAGVNSIVRTTGVGGNLVGNINTGVVTGETYAGAIAGQVMSRTKIEGNCYDAQLNSCGAAAGGALNGASPLLTSTLTAGKAPKEIADADAWTFAEGSYPALKAFADEAIATEVNKLVLKLDELDNARAVTAPASLSSNAKWTVAKGDNFVIDGSTLKVTAPTDTVAESTLEAVAGDVKRTYSLRAVPVVFAGKGTKDDPYQIKTTDDMDKLANAVEKYDMDFEHHYFKVIESINFVGHEYKQVATGDKKFQGYFDGNGKSFYNLNLEDKEASDVALFGNVGAQGTIANLTVELSTVTAKGNVAPFAVKTAGAFINLTNKVDVRATTSGYAAGIAAAGLEGAKFVNCRNSGNISLDAKNYAGGITAVSEYSSYENCVNDGVVITATGYAGGISGAMRASVVNCVNNGEVTSLKVSNYIGGITGQEGAGSKFDNCVNNGNVTMGDRYVGGIVGSSSNETGEHASLITDCVNNGDIEANYYVAGIAGSLAGGHETKNSQNKGKISATKGYAAGIVASQSGKDEYPTIIENCQNYGAVKNTAKDYVAGIVATMSRGDVLLTKCSNYGRIESAGEMVAGIAGQFSGKVTECYNAAPVAGKNRGVAGIVGFGAYAEIDRCFNLDSIVATGTPASQGMAGGILGYGSPLTVTNCYNMGAVTAVNKAAGIVPFYYNGYVIKNCYNAGPVTVTETNNPMVANIMADEKDAESVIENCYFDTTVCAAYPADSIAIATSTAGLTNAKLGEAFANKTALYPTLTAFADNALANYFAAVIVLDDKDDIDHVSQPFRYGLADNTVWTASSNLVLNDGVATSNAIGVAWITKKYGDLSKTWIIDLTSVSGVDGNIADKPVVSREYYDMNGRHVAAPANGVYVEVTKYADGTSTGKKVVK